MLVQKLLPDWNPKGAHRREERVSDCDARGTRIGRGDRAVLSGQWTVAAALGQSAPECQSGAARRQNPHDTALMTNCRLSWKACDYAYSKHNPSPSQSAVPP